MEIGYNGAREGPIFYVSTLIFFLYAKILSVKKINGIQTHRASLDRKYFETTGEFCFFVVVFLPSFFSWAVYLIIFFIIIFSSRRDVVLYFHRVAR